MYYVFLLKKNQKYTDGMLYDVFSYSGLLVDVEMKNYNTLMSLNF